MTTCVHGAVLEAHVRFELAILHYRFRHLLKRVSEALFAHIQSTIYIAERKIDTELDTEMNKQKIRRQIKFTE